jgi:hypothetical protein
MLHTADTPPFQIALMLALAILLAGALVGAVHGAFLVWMQKQPNQIKTQEVPS